MAALDDRYVYISGPLQAAADLAAARRLYDLIAEVCQTAGWNVYLPHQETDPVVHRDVRPASVFQRDYERVRAAALVIAHVGLPSSGVGAELAIAFEHKIPIIAVHRSGERPSRFIAGMLERLGLRTIIFEDESDCKGQLTAALARFGAPVEAVRQPTGSSRLATG